MPKYVHGLSKHSLYPTWLSMKNRCSNINNPRYKHYGGKGVVVCDRWKDSFKNFLDDMGEKPTLEHSLDRIDNNGNYEPKNCRWATYEQQNNNQAIRVDNTSGTPGVKWDSRTNKWVASIKVNNKRVNLGYFKNKQDAKDVRIKAHNNKLKERGLL